jgi:DNA polymerase-1
MRRLLLVDGDIFAYKCASAAEQTVDWGDGQLTVSCNTVEAASALDEWLSQLCKKLMADGLVIALSAQDSATYFRKEIYPPYKTNRVGRKPIGLTAMKEHLLANYKTHQRDGLEGDDILGVMATATVAPDVERIVVSHDKDMLSVPGLHYNPTKSDTVISVTLEQADYWHMIQTLTGDATDGYPGCPGIGPKKAEKLFAGRPMTYAALWPVVIATYLRCGLTEQDARTMAQVARILRAENYNRETKEITLWEPPSQPSVLSDASAPASPPSPHA